jgi:hypothetical protein
MQLLKADLLVIRWLSAPAEGYQPQAEYIAQFRAYLEAATQPIYILSDLRYGKITNVRILQQLGKLTYHPMFGGGTAFAGDISAEVYVGVFSHFASRPKREDVVHANLEAALAYLETLKAGVTEGIDWSSMFE